MTQSKWDGSSLMRINFLSLGSVEHNYYGYSFAIFQVRATVSFQFMFLDDGESQSSDEWAF